MGIRGLQTYLEQYCPSACPYVNIAELIKRKKSFEEQPIIVVDGISTIHILYDDLDWIGGSQDKEFVEKAKEFVNAFEGIGVRLVFFFDGITEPKKRKTWVERRLRTVETVYNVVDEISGGMQSYNIDRFKYFIKPAGLTKLCREVFDLICGCEVHQSLGECDEEIAEYAKSHNAFAILGQDTDYVILDKGEALYLSMNHLNIKTMRTRQYDAVQLAKSLGISMSQLPLLATFMGNDVIPFDDLKSFQRQIVGVSPYHGRVSYQTLIPRIAVYIRSLPKAESELLKHLPEIAQKVLGDRSRGNDILTSIRCYSSLPKKDCDKEDHNNSRTDKWTEIVLDSRQKHMNNEFPDSIYGIINDMFFKSGNIIEDPRKDDLPLFAKVTQPIRRRLYGILLKEKDLEPGEEHRIEEWCVAGPRSLDKPDFVHPVYPKDRHPGLMALWGSDEKYTVDRWQLFVHSVSPLLEVKQLQSIPASMVFPVMILFYISDYLNPWEINAVLATAAVIGHYDAHKLKKLPSDPLLSRGVRLSNLFTKMSSLLNILLAACGYPIDKKKTMSLNFFDGKLFQTKYVAAKSGASHSKLCENMAKAEEHFQMARKLVVGSCK